MKLSHRLGGQSEGRLLWSRWRRLAAPSLFFLGVIYYEELFLKLYCFHGLSLAGAVFTLLFSIPIAMLLGALCGGWRIVWDGGCWSCAPPWFPFGWVHRRCTITSLRPF